MIGTLSATLLVLAQPAGEDGLLAAGKARAVSPPASQLYDLRWRRPVVRTGIFREVGVSLGRPALSKAHDRVIVGQGENEVWALALDDGELVWRYGYSAPFEAAAVVVEILGGGGKPEELVILPARDGKVLALEVATGKLRWKGDLGAEARAPAVVVGQGEGRRLVLSTAANTLHVIEAATGKTVWNAGRGAPRGLSVLGHARATVAGEVVYAAYSDGYVEAYGLGSGSRLWSRPLALSGGEFVDADADPVLANGTLFVASYSEGIFALDPDSGRTIWSRQAPAVVSLVSFEDLVIAGSADGWIWGLRQNNGSIAYRTRLPEGPMARLVVEGGLVLAAAGDAGLLVLDARRGKPLQATPVGDRLASEPVLVGGDLALLSSAGFVYTFGRTAAP